MASRKKPITLAQPITWSSDSDHPIDRDKDGFEPNFTMKSAYETYQEAYTRFKYACYIFPT